MVCCFRVNNKTMPQAAGKNANYLAAAGEDMGFEDCSRPVVAVHTLGKKEPPMLPGVVDEVGDRHQVVEAGRELWQLRKEKSYG